MMNIYRPVFYNLSLVSDIDRFNLLLLEKPFIKVHDTIFGQIGELYKVRNPSTKIVEQSDIQNFMKMELNITNLESYGCWVYYPWSERMVHLLPEDEFIEVRTNRNNNKITTEEQAVLKEKIVGIIGLSVGQSVALTMAMERTCGTLRLADFDDIELSNLNRIRTSIHNMGEKKVIVAAREIAEIDPFLKVEIYDKGLRKDNMMDFMEPLGNRLDLLVEVCDDLAMKINTRVLARKLHIPVVMETNDRCMLDIERFDNQHDLPILHGAIEENDIADFENLLPEQRIQLVLKIVNAEQLSARMKQAFSEMGKTIRSWPQLASSVTMGAGVTTDVVRRILLDEEIESGRWYFDIEDMLGQNFLKLT